MYVRIFALFIFVGVLGSFTEAQGIFGYPYRHGGVEDRSSPTFFASSRSKRAVDSNGETTTKPTTSQATTTNPTTTNPTTTPSSTTPPTSPTTTPSTEPTTPTTPSTTTETTSPTTTEATSPTTTPTTTSATTPTTTSATTPTTTSATTPTTASTTPTSTTSKTTPTTPSTTTPESTKPTSKSKKSSNDLESRSNFDEPEPEDSSKKPESPGDKNPTPGPYFGSGFPGTFGQGYDPYFGYPGFNSIPDSNPNYAWTGTNNGPGFASAGASAGSFAGGYPGYPMAGYPAPSGSPSGYPAPSKPSVGTRGGFQDNTPSPYGGIDPLYNTGPGQFYYNPGLPQFPFQDPSDMIRQIQAQIEAQHKAIANSMASNQGRPFVSNIPNNYYSASSNMNNVRYPTFSNLPNTGVDNSNMELHNRLANEAANYGGGSYGGDGSYGGEGSYGGSGPQFASASIGLSPRGGFQSGLISPVGPGIESRFAEELPAPSGNSFGVFSSSSSSSKTGPDGRQINHKSSITGVNDNGKVYYRTLQD